MAPTPSSWRGAEGTSSRPPTGSFLIIVGIQDRVTTPVDLTAPVDITGGTVVGYDQQWFPFDATAGQRVSVEIKMMNGACEFSARWDMEVVIVDTSGNQIGETYDNLACSDRARPVGAARRRPVHTRRGRRGWRYQ